jgi:hypothetical protein
MARKLKNPGFVTAAALARRLGVSPPSVGKAIQTGRLVAYDGRGERVPPGFTGRKWFKPAEAAEDWSCRRQRFDDDDLGGSGDLFAARTRTARLHGELLQLRLAKEQGELVPKGASIAAVETLGRAVQRAHMAGVGWAEEILAAGQAGGLAAASALLRAKFTELLNSVADMIMAAEAEFEPPGGEPK